MTGGPNCTGTPDVLTPAAATTKARSDHRDTMLLTDKSVRDLLAAFSSPNPTPGGGSAAALASARRRVAAHDGDGPAENAHRHRRRSRGAGVGRIRARRHPPAVDRSDRRGRRRLRSGRRRLQAAEGIRRGTGGAQGGDPAGAARRDRRAARASMRLSAAALEQAKIVAAHGHRAAASDVGVAVALLRAGLRGARLNIEINVGSVSDAVYVGRRHDRNRRGCRMRRGAWLTRPTRYFGETLARSRRLHQIVSVWTVNGQRVGASRARTRPRACRRRRRPCGCRVGPRSSGSRPRSGRRTGPPARECARATARRSSSPRILSRRSPPHQ